MELIAVNMNQQKDINARGSFTEETLLIEGMDKGLQEKLNRFRREEDRRLTLCGELLVRTYAAQRWQLSPAELVREVNRYGKPSLVGRPHCHYNISHSGDWVVAAFDDCPVGVDIERILPIDLTIANRYFAPSEAAQLQAKHGEAQAEHFYRLWTLKESYLKAVGTGLSAALNSVVFDLSVEDRIGFKEAGDTARSWHFKFYGIDPGYVMAACGSRPDFPLDIHKLSWEELKRCYRETATGVSIPRAY